MASKVIPPYSISPGVCISRGSSKLEVAVLARFAGSNPMLADAAVSAVRAWKLDPVGGESTELVELRFDRK